MLAETRSASRRSSSRKLRSTLRSVAVRLRDVSGLMGICADGTAPERGAEHLRCVLKDLEPDFSVLGVSAVDQPTATPRWDAWRGRIAALRTAYAAEVERLAEELRPRFEAGELRAVTGGDLDDGEDGRTSPFWKLGEVCAERFGCTVTRAEEEVSGDIEAARLVLLASPRAEALEGNWQHPGYHAKDAAAWDVIAVARARGMYVPGADEDVDPLVSELRATA